MRTGRCDSVVIIVASSSRPGRAKGSLPAWRPARTCADHLPQYVPSLVHTWRIMHATLGRCPPRSRHASLSCADSSACGCATYGKTTGSPKNGSGTGRGRPQDHQPHRERNVQPPAGQHLPDCRRPRHPDQGTVRPARHFPRRVTTVLLADHRPVHGGRRRADLAAEAVAGPREALSSLRRRRGLFVFSEDCCGEGTSSFCQGQEDRT